MHMHTLKKKQLIALFFIACIYQNALPSYTPTHKKPQSLTSTLRDIGFETLLAKKFFQNSNTTIEVDADNFPQIDRIVEKLAKKAHINKPLVFVITHASHNFPDKINAQTFGDKDRSLIFLGSWLIDNLSKTQLKCVLAHEIAHIQKMHTLSLWFHQIKTNLASGAALLSTYHLTKKLGFSTKKKIFACAMSTFFTYTIGTFLYNRKNKSYEKEADLGAVSLPGKKDDLCNALRILTKSLKKYIPHTYRNQDSHPTLKERIAYIQEAESPTPN
jgi:Zn-dependent protease with chaperone function